MTHTKGKLKIGILIVEDGSPVIRMAYPDVRNSIIKVASCNTTETLVGYTDNDEEPPVKLGSPFDIYFAQHIVECVNGWDKLKLKNHKLREALNDAIEGINFISMSAEDDGGTEAKEIISKIKQALK